MRRRQIEQHRRQTGKQSAKDRTNHFDSVSNAMAMPSVIIAIIVDP